MSQPAKNPTTKEIRSKFTGKCRACKVAIQPGDLVYWTPGEKGILCPECFDPDTVQKPTKPEPIQPKQPKKDQRLELVDRILEKNSEIKKLYNELDAIKSKLRDQMAIGEILESQFGKVSVTAYKRKVIKTEAVKAALNDGSLSKADFKALFKQELKLTDMGNKALENGSQVIENCVKQIENERMNIFHTNKPKTENVVSFPDGDEIPF